MKAVNLLGDADTIGAICGQLAGALYGWRGLAGDSWGRMRLTELQRWDPFGEVGRPAATEQVLKVHSGAEHPHFRLGSVWGCLRAALLYHHGPLRVLQVELRQKEGHPAVRVFDQPNDSAGRQTVGEIPSRSSAWQLMREGDFAQVVAEDAAGRCVEGWVGIKNVVRVTSVGTTAQPSNMDEGASFTAQEDPPRPTSEETAMSAWQCAAAAQRRNAIVHRNLDHPEAAKCVQGDCFFGEKVTTASGDFICNTSNGLYVPLQDPSTKAWNFKDGWAFVAMCFPLHRGPPGRFGPRSASPWSFAAAGRSDKSEAIVQPGARISALPAPGKPGWLLEAASKKYLPMNHPSTGDVLFNKVDLEPGAASNVQQTTYTCLSQGGVQCRRSPDLSDKADMVIQHGQQIKGQQSAPGWIQDSASGRLERMTARGV
eukprot:g11175.t1